MVYNKDMNIMQQAESHMFYHKNMIVIQWNLSKQNPQLNGILYKMNFKYNLNVGNFCWFNLCKQNICLFRAQKLEVWFRHDSLYHNNFNQPQILKHLWIHPRHSFILILLICQCKERGVEKNNLFTCRPTTILIYSCT